MMRDEYERYIAFLERNSDCHLTLHSNGRIEASHRRYEWDGKTAASIHVVEKYEEWILKR